MFDPNPPPSIKDNRRRRVDRATRNPPSRLFTLFSVWLLALWLFPTMAAEPSCPVDGIYVTYESDTGELNIPAIEMVDAAGQSQEFFQAKLRLVKQTPENIWFEVMTTTPIEAPTTQVPARYDVANELVELSGYVLGPRGEVSSFTQAQLTLNAETNHFLLTELTEQSFDHSGINAPIYTGDETVFSLVRGGADQFLLPVEIGNQTLNLLVDTGSDALLVFEDRLSDCNRSVRKREDNPIRISDTPVSKSYASGTRQGVLATAPIRIGTYAHPDMQIMLIQTPDSQNDPSLTAKGADGIIGLRHTAGLNLSNDAALLDAPMNLLSPQVGRVEFNLPPAGDATLAFGKQPLLEQADDNYVFRAKAKAIADPNDRTLRKRFADMQVPFRVKTSYGEAADEDLDILLDTGAVSRLVLDTQVAEKLGYNAAKGEWMIDQDEEIELNLIGLTETTTLYPKFKVWEVSVAPYSTMGVEFEAVLGISRWQEYIVGFDFVPDYNGGPDGTISLLRRVDMHAVSEQTTELSKYFLPLHGLNSVGNDEFPTTDKSGNLIAFQSDRNGGMGGIDVYVWQRDVGLLSLPNLNSAANETQPALSADGQILAYESDQNGIAPLGLNIYLYDLTQQQPIELPALLSEAEDSMPTLSGDGRYIAFVSQRNGNSDIYLYDRDNATFIDLPNVNSGVTESAPALSEDGRYLAFTQTLPTNNGQAANEDIHFYDIQTQTLLPLSNGVRGVNTLFNEQQPTLLGNQRLAFHSNRRNPEMGLYNRDLFVIDMITQIPTVQVGLNSDFDEIVPRFSGDGRLLVFQSRRPGGLGGSDIYLYSLESQADNTATVEVPPQNIAFNPTDTGLFTAPVAIEGQNFNLLVDTHFNALLVFQDRATDFVGADAVTVNLGNGQVNGILATTQVLLGQHQADAMRIVLADRTEVEMVLGISTDNADGILGLAWRPHLPAGAPPAEGPLSGPPPGPPPTNLPDVPLQTLQPAVNLLEMNFGAQAGLTLNRLPVTGDNERAQHSGMPGVRAPGGGYTELRIPVTFVAYGADDADPLHTFGIPQGVVGGERQLPRAALCSLFTDQIMLDSAVAEALGYDVATQSWGPVERLDLSFLLLGSDALLPIADNLPVNQIQVTDFSVQDYRIVLGSQYWNRYTLGIDYLSSGSSAMLFLADSADSSTVDHSIELAGDHFIPLPGVNTIADEEFGTISADGQTIAFYSNRREGHSDIYVWRVEEGLLDLPNLNSDQIDRNPSLNGDGTLLAFESTRHGKPDIMLYDLVNREFIGSSGLNTTFPEQYPVLSADGSQLAYMSFRDNVHNGSLDIYVYDIDNQQAGRVSSRLNTNGDEMQPALNADGTLLAFSGANRDDNNGLNDVYLQRQGRLQTLPNLNTQFMDTSPALSANGHFLAFFSDRYESNRAHLGNDIFLMELSSGELLDLPGLNSDYEDTSPALTQDAEYILFQSKRPGGAGGYDLYLYHRDTEDDTRYTVSEAYLEDGYVSDASGRTQANALVQVTDGDGNAVGSAETDSAGNFTVSIPAGVVLPLAYMSDDGTVIIDEVGDDTYIPDFEAGNLKFTQVWVEDTMQAGMPTKIWFDVETETPKYNTFVKLYLVKLATGSIDELEVNGGDFEVAHTLTALSIEKLGQIGPGDTITQTQGQDIATEISYLTEDNRQAHVEHSFIAPTEVEDGTYAVVFSINRFDYHPEDDALQSEEVADQDDNFLAAPASVIIGQPDKPNLRILSAKLNSNSFELPAKRPVEGSTPFSSELTLNMEVESMAQDTKLPVDITFALEVDGQRYPLTFADNQGSRPSQLAKKTYPVTCRAETREGYLEGERCASLFKQEQTGYTYKLYINGDTYDALTAKTADTLVDLVVQLDPEATIAEWENNTTDNVKVMPVMYLVPRMERRTRGLAVTEEPVGVEGWPDITDYGTDFFTPLSEDELYGNDDFGAGYAFNASLTYAESSINGTAYPYAAALDATGNDVYVNIFGIQVDVLSVDVGADFDGDQILCTWFAYDVNVMGVSGVGYAKTWQAYYHVDGIDPDACNTLEEVQEVELWNSQDDDGNEKYQVSKSKDYEKTFTVGPVPVTVAAGATGELGIKGSVVIDTSNTLTLSAGPYLSLTGYAEGGVGITGFTAGIGVNLLILGIDLPFTATLQVLPSYPIAIFTFEAPLIISTLDGDMYIFAKILLDEYTYTIVEWTGFEWEIPLMDPVWLAWADETEKFALKNQSGSPPSNLDFTTETLDYDWGSGESDFEAQWRGKFDFEPGTYIFTADADDYLEVHLDSDGDGNYDTGLFGTGFVDLAGDNNASVSGAGWHSEDGLFGVEVRGSVRFDGSNDYLTLSTQPIPTTIGTIEHWVKSNGGTTDVLVYTGDNSGAVYDGFGVGSDTTAVEIHTAIDSNGKAYFHFHQINNANGVSLNGTTTINDGHWHHVAATYDYTGTIRLYVDGNQEDYVNVSGYGYGDRDETYGDIGHYIGRPIESTRYFDGQLDEVRIWNTVRSQSQIQAYKNVQLTGHESNLVAYYRFDEPREDIMNGVEFTEDTTATILVNYEHTENNADLSFSWSQLNTFNVWYYGNTTLSGDAALADLEKMIDHDWGASSPDDEVSIPADGFSARWEGTFDFFSTSGGSGNQSMVFVVASDDSAVELYLDNSLISLSATNDADTYYGTATVTEGGHDLKLEYVHSSGDAKIKLDWLPAEAWFVVPYHRDGDDWTVFDDPSVETDINEDPIEGQTGTKDMLWDYRGFFNFTQAGKYDFIVRADDGIKLIIDGKEYLGHWRIDEATAYIVPVTLTEGYHLIQVEHYDEQTVTNNYMVREVDWSRRQNNEFIGFYYSTLDDMDADDPWDADDYDGTEPLVIGKTADAVTGCTFTSTSLNCDWGTSAPTVNLDGIDSAYLNTNSFGVRWIGDFEFTEGVYVFTAAADDGVRVWVDDVIVIDEWQVTATLTYQEAVPMSAGTHNIRIEYWENTGGADIAVNWTEISQDTFNVQYFDSTNLTGTPTDGGTVSSIDYSSGSDSARWVGVFEFEESDYTFTVNTDGGVRVYLDGNAIIDEWVAQSSSTAYTTTIALEEGMHSLKVEYFEGNSGTPAIDVSWSSDSEIAGNALAFDGDDYVEMSSYTGITGTNARTVEAWIKTSTTGAIVSWGTETDGEKWIFRVQNDNGTSGAIRAEVDSGYIVGSTVVNDGEWHHVTATFEDDGTPNVEDIKLYVDGVLETTSVVNTQSINTADGENVKIANDHSNRYFDGEIDEVRIWNVARSQAEIQAYMKSTLNGTESNLVAYYQFNESSGTTASDTTGSYDGTLNGDPQWVTSDALLTEMTPPGSALSFDGSDDYVELPFLLDPGSTDTFTGELWFKTDLSNTKQVLFDQSGGGADVWFYIKNNKLVSYLGHTNLFSTNTFSVGDWHHAAVVYDNGTVKLYLDGVLENSGSRTLLSSSNTFLLGVENVSSSWFDGSIDEVRIWNTARTQAEIQAYINRTLEGDENGLIAYYTFDKPTGSTATILTDTVGSNHGTLYNGPTWTTSEATLSKVVAPGNALSFDGTNDYVEIPHFLDPAAQDGFTAELWVKPDNVSAYRRLIHQQDGTGSAGRVWLGINNSGLPYTFIGGNYMGDDTPLNTGTWYHLAMVYDNGTRYLYVDGNLANSSSVTVETSDGDLVLGIDKDLSGQKFDGTMDEVRIWNVARTQAEIQANMYRALGSFESGLVAYYRFDQDSGTEVVDITSFDNDGTLNSSPTWVTSEVPMD